MEITVEILEEQFEEYNELYFGGRLPWPDEFYLFKSFKCYGRFYCAKHAPGSKMRNVRIGISKYYDWTEEHLRNIFVHEMLHYKLERSKNAEKKIHGPRFLKAAAELNENYGLNIVAHPYLFGIKVSPSAHKHSLARFIFAPPSEDPRRQIENVSAMRVSQNVDY